jgi:hypothetical protein
MEQYEALTNVIRALSKKCEQFEHHKDNAETYYRWYKEQKKENERLLEHLDNLERQLHEAGLPYNELERNDND